MAVIELADTGDPAAVALLTALVADPDAGVRQQAALALGEFDGPDAAAALVRLLVDPEQAVAAAAAESMAELKDPAERRCDLSAGRRMRTPSSAWRALRALKELRRKDALKVALDALRDADASVRVQAVGVIGFLKLEEAVPALTAATGDADAHVRRGAVSALAFSGMKTAGEAIVRALSDDGLDGARDGRRNASARAAGTPAADALIKALADEFWQVRLKAMRSLGTLKVERAVGRRSRAASMHRAGQSAQGSGRGARRDRRSCGRACA